MDCTLIKKVFDSAFCSGTCDYEKVGWNNLAQQELPFLFIKELLELCNNKINLVDAGAGLGSLGDFLFSNGVKCNYIPLEFSENHVASLKAKAYTPVCCDLTDISQLEIEAFLYPEFYNVVCFVGVFNLGGYNDEEVLSVINKFINYDMIIISFLDKELCDYYNKNFSYFDPLKLAKDFMTINNFESINLILRKFPTIFHTGLAIIRDINKGGVV